ncbi:MAG: GTPase RsgA, partial [Gaiellaceae bacterium]
MPDLEALGWDDRLGEQFEHHAAGGLIAGRIAVQHRGAYDVLVEEGELRCDVTGRLVHEAASPAELPVVGDWVAIAARPGESSGTIQAVLPRRTKFSRKTAWQAAEEQVLAANVDVVFLVTSLNEDLNLRRLERYLTLAWESGAQPVIVLTKSDLHPAPETAIAAVGAIAYGVPVHAVSNRT